jgi:hypothetical protein
MEESNGGWRNGRNELHNAGRNERGGSVAGVARARDFGCSGSGGAVGKKQGEGDQGTRSVGERKGKGKIRRGWARGAAAAARGRRERRRD